MAAEKHGEIINRPFLDLSRFVPRGSLLRRGYFHFNWRLLRLRLRPFIFHYFDARAIHWSAREKSSATE